MKRVLPVLGLMIAASLQAQAQTVVTSPGPSATAVTVYRDPDRGDGGIDARFPNGFALVTETRRITLPAGESLIRFEGVAEGMIAVSAVVAGLPGGVVQKNRDARLLSPAALLDGTLGNRVHLRRTSRQTGRVVEQDAVIRSGPDGAVVLQTAEGFEALRCSGLPETIVYDSVPDGLSAKPTLSVSTSSPDAADADVTLTYLATGFDWGANYVARIDEEGRALDLFAWLTVANGNETDFADARLLAVAGRLNRQGSYDALVEDAPAPELMLQCWPMDSTSTAPDISPPPPPLLLPAPAPVMMARAEAMQDIMVTGSKVARQEDLGDLKLYRVPMRVDVNAKGQKQVALLERRRVPFRIVYRTDVWPASNMETSRGIGRILRLENREKTGLGLPLPAGGVALFEPVGEQPLLLANGRMRDHAIGEEVEIEAGESAQVRIRQIALAPGEASGGKPRAYRLDLANALDRPVAVEVRIARMDGRPLKADRKLASKDGMDLWAVTVPANGTATLGYTLQVE